MSSIGEGARLKRLLNHLYLKKRWLDTMISGLESAVGSADHQFIESVTRVLGDPSQPKPTVDLRRQQRAKLARLATQVTKSSAGRRKTNGEAAL